MKLSKSHVVLTAVLALTASLPAFADNLIVNGGFGSGSFNGYTTANLTYTSVVASGVDDHSAYAGSYYAALGNVGTDGCISQTISDTAGQLYNFSFELASDGATPNDFSASVDSTTLLSLTNIPAGGYNLYSFDFVGTGSDSISFTERDDPGYLALDTINVSAVTPEPSSILLLATGMAATAGALRRRLVRA